MSTIRNEPSVYSKLLAAGGCSRSLCFGQKRAFGVSKTHLDVFLIYFMDCDLLYCVSVYCCLTPNCRPTCSNYQNMYFLLYTAVLHAPISMSWLLIPNCCPTCADFQYLDFESKLLSNLRRILKSWLLTPNCCPNLKNNERNRKKWAWAHVSCVDVFWCYTLSGTCKCNCIARSQVHVVFLNVFVLVLELLMPNVYTCRRTCNDFVFTLRIEYAGVVITRSDDHVDLFRSWSYTGPGVFLLYVAFYLFQVLVRNLDFWLQTAVPLAPIFEILTFDSQLLSYSNDPGERP